MRVAAITILFWTATAPTLAQGNSPPRLTQEEVASYRTTARLVFSRVAALKDRFPHLTAIGTAVREEDDPRRLWISYHYEHGLSLVPNPDYRAGLKSSATLKSFSPTDGIELNIYFFEGQWPGQAAVWPVAIGAMNVVVFIEGQETDQLKAIRQAVADILRGEQSAFMKRGNKRTPHRELRREGRRALNTESKRDARCVWSRATRLFRADQPQRACIGALQSK
jgi:hypothetical protein